MELFDIIRTAQGGHAIDNLARAYRIAPEDAAAAVKAVLPELSWNLERNTLSRGGLADLVEALGQGHHGQILDNPQTLGDPRLTSEGNAILAKMLGNKDASRAVASRAAATSGLSESLIKMLLPILATWLMGALGKQTGGGLGDILSKLPEIAGGGQGLPRPGRGPQPGATGSGWPSSEDTGSGMPPLPQSGPIDVGAGMGRGGALPWPQRQDRAPERAPAPRDDGGTAPPFPWPQPQSRGNPMPGGIGGGRGGEITGQRPLPMPGDTIPGVPGTGNNPYGDLSDIIRKGTGAGPGGMGGGVLWSIVRNILGGALGFGGKGVFGWFARLILMRFAWPILRTILGKVVLGR